MIDIFINNLPSLDLHGYDRETARVAINDFIRDNIHLKNKKIVIIHGKGTGIIRETVKITLTKHKNVQNFYLSYFNDGSTVVELKFDK